MISLTPYGAISVRLDHGKEFKVNGQRLKHYSEKGKLMESFPLDGWASTKVFIVLSRSSLDNNCIVFWEVTQALWPTN